MTTENRSAIMETAFSDEGNRNMRVATCAALYLVLALLWMPGFSFSTLDLDSLVIDERVPPRVIFTPPPEKVEEITVKRETKAKKTPMPDNSPDEPEVLVEPEPLETPDVLATDDWVIGIPEHTPASEPTIIYQGMADVEEPIITNRVQPNYPPRALKLGMQGYVLLQAVMRKDGTIGDIKIIRGLGQGKVGFEQAAIDSVRKWTFVPGKYKDKPADIILNLRVNFVLAN